MNCYKNKEIKLKKYLPVNTFRENGKMKWKDEEYEFGVRFFD